MLASEERIRLLSLVDIFEPLSREEIEQLNGQLPDVHLKPGEIFYSPPAGEYRERLRSPTPISPASEKSSTPSSLPRAPETSMRCSQCSTRKSCAEQISVPSERAYEGGPWCAGRGRASAHLLAVYPLRTAGARERGRGSRRGSRGTAVCGDGLHGGRREDRRDRHT